MHRRTGYGPHCGGGVSPRAGPGGGADGYSGLRRGYVHGLCLRGADAVGRTVISDRLFGGSGGLASG